MKGKICGVGVGPGDPELMTLKACRLIREADVIAVPGEVPEESVAYKIAVRAVPELRDKTLLPVPMPMVKNREALRRRHRESAELIAAYLDQGKDVVFLTLGDAAIYSTYTYLQAILKEGGYETALVNGIPSFCAAASALNIPLTEWDEPLHILPAVHRTDAALDQPGTYVLMKSGTRLKEVKARLAASGRKIMAVENCGMADERIYRSEEELPEEAGYFTLIIAKESRDALSE